MIKVALLAASGDLAASDDVGDHDTDEQCTAGQQDPPLHAVRVHSTQQLLGTFTLLTIRRVEQPTSKHACAPVVTRVIGALMGRQVRLGTTF